MAENRIDARGLSCPQPVLLVAGAVLKNVFPIVVLVDGMTAEENIRRYAESKNLKVSINHHEDEAEITIAN